VAAEAHLQAIVTEVVEEQSTSRQHIIMQAVLDRISDLEREKAASLAEPGCKFWSRK